MLHNVRVGYTMLVCYAMLCNVRVCYLKYMYAVLTQYSSMLHNVMQCHTTATHKIQEEEVEYPP